MCKTVKLNRRRFSEGNAKIKMNDGSVVIAQVHRGVLNGFRREWDPEGLERPRGEQNKREREREREREGE